MLTQSWAQRQEQPWQEYAPYSVSVGLSLTFHNISGVKDMAEDSDALIVDLVSTSPSLAVSVSLGLVDLVVWMFYQSY